MINLTRWLAQGKRWWPVLVRLRRKALRQWAAWQVRTRRK